MLNPSFVLATDLDGTFLGGSEAQRRNLYDHLLEQPDHLLIFVTGRDVDFIRDLVAQPGMPRPHYIIGDVGTSVFHGSNFEPIVAVEAPIASSWEKSASRVADMLDGHPRLRLQPVPFRHRRSYYYDPATFPRDVLQEVEGAGLDWILSADEFFDVLPRGVSKGPTLMRLLRHLGLSEERVLVAGDTLNDLSLYETGLRGVAVGNAEAPLLERIETLPNAYRSDLPGAAGISDALRHFGFSNVKEFSS